MGKNYIEPFGDEYLCKSIAVSFNAGFLDLRARKFYKSNELLYNYSTVKQLIEIATGPIEDPQRLHVSYKKKRKRKAESICELSTLEQYAQQNDRRKVDDFLIQFENQSVKCKLEPMGDNMKVAVVESIAGCSTAAAGVGIGFLFPPIGLALLAGGVYTQMSGA